MSSYEQHPSSYRDPSGFIFESSGKLFRQINNVYREHYELLMSSGLYQVLAEKQWLILHRETSSPIGTSPDHFKTIEPEFISFISYPYEWCFEQLKDAALLTLNVMRTAMTHGMIIKDATPYNVQFRFATPIMIDTLSFQKYDETKPWVAYRQFCETFFYPLLISSYTGIEVSRLFAAYPEGVDAQTTATLLPAKANFNVGNWLHVFIPAKVKGSEQKKEMPFDKTKLLRIVEDLFARIKSIRPSRSNKLGWENYYDETVLSEEYLLNKQQIVADMIEKIEAQTACDVGCNRGVFSSLLAKKIPSVVSIDADEGSISGVYAHAQKNNEHILPLCVDLANPSGDGGFNNEERKGFLRRMRYDAALALALVHHLAIGKNIPFDKLVELFKNICNQLIIEFVPKEDEKVQQLLLHREDIFTDYSKVKFEQAFARYFEIMATTEVEGSRRTIYLMKRKS